VAAKLQFEHNLPEILAALKATDAQTKALIDQIGAYSKSVSDGISQPTKKVETTLQKMNRMGKESLQGLGNSIKTFLGVQAIQAGLSISNQFKDTLSNTLKLSDAVRKLGDYYGIAENKRVDFQAQIGKALGEKGLGMEVGAAAMLGLRGQGVKSPEALTQYAVSAGSLASIGGEKGSEGAIAAGLADALRMRGIDSQNLVEMRKLSESVNEAMQKTGTAATDILSGMTRLYAGMSQEQKKKLGPGAMAQMAAIEAQVGPGALSFLQPALGAQTFAEKERVKALGMDKLVGSEGLKLDEFQKFMRDATKLGGGDVATGLRAKGLSSEQVSAAMMTMERMPAIRQDLQRGRPGAPLEQQVGRTRGLQDTSEAMQNRVLGWASNLFAAGSQGATDIGQKLSESNAGSAAGVAGAAALSGGLVGKGIGALTGAASTGTAAGAALPLVAAGGAGLAAGKAVETIGQSQAPQWVVSGQMNMIKSIENGFEKLARVFQGGRQEVHVKTSKDLQLTRQPTRGASQGPNR
jgi:hypothetical protein